MLKEYKDYQYKYNTDGSIQFTRTEGDTTENGVLVQGRKRKKKVEDETLEYEPYQDVLDLLALGEITIEAADPPYEPTYREKRAKEYAERISPEGNVITSLGDSIDAIISAVVDKDFTKLNEIKAIIDNVKTKNPKK